MTQAMTHQDGATRHRNEAELHLSRGKVGMSCLIITESFFFVCFIEVDKVLLNFCWSWLEPHSAALVM